MKLREFPFILRVFQYIELDNGGHRARKLKPETEVPAYWDTPFMVVERVLKKIGDVQVGATSAWTLKLVGIWNDVLENEPVWQIIASGGDDQPEIVMKAMGVHEVDQWLVQQVLNQFFDGELSGVFTEEWRH